MEPITAVRPAIAGMCPYIQVFDMPLSLQFYRDVVGFVVSQSSGADDDVDWVLLQLGESWLMLNTIYEKDDRPPKPDPARAAGHEDTAFFFSCRDLDLMYTYLVSKNVKVTSPFKTGYGFKAINLKDPDGYGLTFHWPLEEGK
ncbi:VOC family protein [Pseudobacter ginsenosidimutans]|jgi:catechol-2,3-dioxygenase|uniref:Glyoxalase/bleomycin resistance protein/dioxygenase superfamily protein n=1 Tax=Pseudobacter ginsenosidimutans TaxID=661488 RepID=A0A4Q7N665_9BACT|nr:VOC family protein [Pseudobacter ginsenosidimutans]QEC45067.1 VOC family protein [Pseudobacter ginsenosidimutans]RZS76562.1 glyoxalase/bleomycin resistance protein/dioxygenase superfamily protein [Pseudobacter ginsenosidimutans]